MIVVPTSPWAHYLGDLCAWAAASAASLWQHRRWPQATRRLAGQTAPGYFVTLAVSALLGAWLLGSLNSMRSQILAPSHSVAGALAGGILGVELWKWRHGVHGSTGGSFVLPLCVGLVVGRFGCLFAGRADFTYGTPTTLPWAVDLGDGVGRHPVPVYEAAAMAGFAVVYTRARLAGRRWARVHGFHVMTIFYAAQRFF